jgi:hypothetical protein
VFSGSDISFRGKVMISNKKNETSCNISFNPNALIRKFKIKFTFATYNYQMYSYKEGPPQDKLRVIIATLNTKVELASGKKL